MSFDKPPQIRSGNGDWERIGGDADFRRLLINKAKFLVPATIFFMVYYFALPVLVAYAPGLMEHEVFARVNVAYLFALSQFFMAWILAWFYVRAAARWDRAIEELLKKFNK